MGIGQDQLKPVFQQIVDRPPIDACAFHRHLPHLQTLQPSTQGQQPSRRRGEDADGLVNLAIGVTDDDAGHHRLFVQV